MVYLKSDSPELGDELDTESCNFLMKHFENSYTEEKVLFRKHLENSPKSIGEYSYIEFVNMESGVRDLVIESGAYSRFNLDSKFPESLFQAMYIRWLENSLSNPDLKAIGVCNREGDVVGLVIVNLTNSSVGKIDLIAVDSRFRGKNIGRELLAITDILVYSTGRKIVDVVTQSCNALAMRFYEKMASQLKSRNIFIIYGKRSKSSI